MNDAKETEDMSTAEAIVWTIAASVISVIILLLLLFLFCLAVSLGINIAEAIVEYFIWRGGVIGG